ncbi:SPOR domain-containing protein [Sphingomonas sp. ac-8]|uniref:SPOR domain-containing protein n=1 Tax=Sphingomonas sp. ac-8 TaxID=3242977 RepID=UPI003A7F886E
MDVRSDDGRDEGTATTGRVALSIGLSALLFGGLTVGCTAVDPKRVADANATARVDARSAALAAKAEAAIARRKGAAAVRYAERAVALDPADPRYRSLLGHAYLHAGRFASAAQACGDALSLDPRDGRAALDLALAQTALGDWTAARSTLATYAEILSPADRGLTLALAGDPIGGATLIGQEARGPTGTATARQNLALALALAGRWPEARAVAAVDVPADQLEQRMQKWMTFVRPTTSSQQVATLLGVQAVEDAGQPAALALVRTTPATAVAEAAVPSVEPVSPEPAIEAAGASANDGSVVVAGVRFAPLREIVQPIAGIAAAILPSAGTPVAPRVVQSAAAAPVPAPTRGRYYVQLGAYDSSAVAHDAWDAARRRYRALAGLTPSGAEARVGGDDYYRLSVGGFARGEALALCRRLRGQGGRCFVRDRAGDAVASWTAPGAQLAAR